VFTPGCRWFAKYTATILSSSCQKISQWRW